MRVDKDLLRAILQRTLPMVQAAAPDQPAGPSREIVSSASMLTITSSEAAFHAGRLVAAVSEMVDKKVHALSLGRRLKELTLRLEDYMADNVQYAEPDNEWNLI